jgi:hypothetical protein
MVWQRNADILMKILLAINARSSPITIVKVKSHRGVQLNEQADVLADTAASPPPDGEDDGIDTMYIPEPPDSAINYQWLVDGEDELRRTADHKTVWKRWDEVSRTRTTEREVRKDTFACQLMTREKWGQHLWQVSKNQRAWTETEERRWMQMTGRVFPVNSYLRRIDKHPTGDCPWCGTGVKETLAHFQSECPQFAPNRTAAHHAIARAVVAQLKDLRLSNWTFFYETEIQHLPFKFKWASVTEEREQEVRRPDGVAWNPVKGEVIFLEFTRAMDNPDNMAAACIAKGAQYDVPIRALRRAQDFRATKHKDHIYSITTAPLIFGVRGTVLMDVASEALRPLGLTHAQMKTTLARGVRAAITAASEMCSARFAALRSVPAAPRGPNGKRIRIIIPPKPFVATRWRGERGW